MARLAILPLFYSFLFFAGCSGGDSNTENIGTYEYIQLDDGRVSKFIYQAPWEGSNSSPFMTDLPNGVAQTFTFEPPVLLDEDRFVSLEQNTLIRMSESQEAVTAGLISSHVMIDQWNLVDPYFGGDIDHELQTISIFRQPSRWPFLNNPFNANTPDGWIFSQLILWAEGDGVTTREMLVVDAGTTFSIHRVGYRLVDGSDDGGNSRNPAYNTDILAETFDVQLLIENSPWYTYRRTGISLGIFECGQRYIFYTDGRVSVSSPGDDEIILQYMFRADGRLSIFGDGFPTREIQLTSVTKFKWSGLLQPNGQETAYSNGPGEAATNLPNTLEDVGIDCGFLYE